MKESDDEWYIVNGIDDLINSSRALVFNNFGKSKSEDPDDLISFTVDPKDIKELDSVLSFEESKVIVFSIIKKQRNKISKQIRYLLNNDMYEKIIGCLNDRMVSNILNGLVNKGLVETAYDDEADDFVFWIKDEKNFGEKK